MPTIRVIFACVCIGGLERPQVCRSVAAQPAGRSGADITGGKVSLPSRLEAIQLIERATCLAAIAIKRRNEGNLFLQINENQFQLPYRGPSGLSQSCSTTLKREVLISIPPLYLMKPSFLNLFMNKFTRVRVVPTISASVSCDTLGSTL